MILKAAFVLLLGSAIPASATSAYMITTEDSITSADEFGTINLSTGAFTLLGNTDVGGNPADPETLSGLGEVGSVLYGEAGGTLYSINTANGDLTAIGTGTQEFYEFGSTLTGLYGVSSSNGDLYSVSTTDGSMTQVGTGPGFGGGSASLSTGSSTLYFTVFNGGYNLYTVNTTTGAATEIGSAGSPGIPTGALLWDASTSTLFTGKTKPGTDFVDTLNTTTGVATQGPALTGTGSGDEFGGFAPIIPEPATWSLLAMGLALMAGMKQRGKRRA
jgi:hypothetical protein